MVRTSRAARARARRMRRRLLVGCSLLLAFLVVAATAGYGYVHYRFGQIRSVKVPGLHRSGGGRPFNILVVGSDTREGLDDAGGRRYGHVDGQRNDTTLIVRVEPARRHVSMLSIPRDLVVAIAGTGGENRINAALTGGPGRLVQTIQRNLGIPVHHYVLVDFDGFQAIVDAVGGIDVRFPFPARDPRSGLDIREAGCRHLNGARALALARSRYFAYQKDGVWRSDPWADLGRIRRQQAFLQALVKAALKRGLANPVRANALTGSLVREVTKDSALRANDVIRAAAAFRSFDPANLATYTLPVTVSTTHPLGDVLLLKQPDARRVVDQFLGRVSPPPATGTGAAAARGDAGNGSALAGAGTGAGRADAGAGAAQGGAGVGAAGTRAGAAAPADTRVTVLNALGASGLAASTATKLRRFGYRIAGIGNAPSADLSRSQIAYPPGRLPDAEALAATLLSGARLVEDPALTTPNLTLILGPGFTGIRPHPAPGSNGAGSEADGSGAVGYGVGSRDSGKGSSGSGPAGSFRGATRPRQAEPDLRPYDPRPC